jgi:hypothetical protein
MAGERKVQEFLEKLCNAGALHNRIEGRDEIERLAGTNLSEGFLPNFNLDFLLRIRAIQSARAVFDALAEVEIVSNSRRSISADRQGQLYPDLILFSRRTGHFVIFEIKRDWLATREAVTELFAYEQEIRNQMPYISSDQIMYVIVSDSYPTLLTHAIGQAILWQRKNVLAVLLGESSSELTLKVTLPTGWSSTRLNHVPEHCIRVSELSVRPREDVDPSRFGGIPLDLTFLMAREGDITGSHGFVLVSHDHDSAKRGRHEDVYTIGVISAETMLSETLTRSDGSLRHNPLAAYVTSRLPGITATYDAITQIARPAVEALSKLGDCSITSQGTLADWRMGVAKVGNVLTSYSPYAMVMWGLPNTYRQILTTHSGLTRRIGFLRKSSPQDARVGLFVLNALMARTPFQDGEFEYHSLWQFGRTLGAALATLGGLAGSLDTGIPHPEVALEWLGHDVVAGLLEVGFRAEGVDRLANPPPVSWGGPSHAVSIRDCLENWIVWFREEFLAGHERHKKIFDIGITMYPLYDAQLGFANPDAQLAKLQDAAVELAREALDFAKSAIEDPAVPLFRKERLQGILAQARVPVEMVELALVPKSTLIEALPTLLNAFDELLPSVLHEVSSPDFSTLDWHWIKDEVLKAVDAGNQSVAVLLFPSGEISVADLGTNYGPLPVVHNYQSETLLAIEQSGHVLTVTKVSWSDLVSGRAFR